RRPSVDRGARAELIELDRLLPIAGLERTLAPAFVRRGRRELLANHAQRQELVPLQAENRLEPLDVLVAEHPVPALRPPRRQQSLILEVPDLRDRDVRELLLQ